MKHILLIFLIFPLLLTAQVNDDFSDGDFTNSPSWTGDTIQFEINSLKQLHLKSAEADTSYLSTANSLINNTEWQFWIKLSFNTSSNNNARVYLVSDKENIKSNLNGYFVQIGEANDSIALFKQSGNIIRKIIPGSIALTNNSTNILRIKVTRDNTGNWNLYSDIIGGTNFQLEGSAFDNTFLSTSYFGIFCKYTISNKTKFYFDDFYVGPIIVDTIPPYVSQIKVISSKDLDILFSEDVDKNTAETITNYSVDNQIGNPILAERDKNNLQLVHLTFSKDFIDGNFNTLKITNVEDIEGNAISSISKTFAYHIIKAFDVVINEIMADPEPSVALPDYEYIELFNRTSLPLNLDKWTITLGSSVKTFTNITIEPDAYLILSKDEAEPSLSSYGNIFTFSSFSITNAGQSIVLKDTEGKIIHSICFSDEWYRNSYKKEGGWSLEQIDPFNPCGRAENWQPSVDTNGGTPGKLNSVFADNPDNKSPELIRVSIIDDSTIQLYFSESMDSLSLDDKSKYSIDNGIGNPFKVRLMPPDFSSVVLELPSMLLEGNIYTISITDTLTDCIGNILPLNSSVRFAIPSAAEPMDLIINEVLSNPRDDGVDFVEIYNKSNKVIDLKNFLLSSMDTVASILTSVKNISQNSFLMFPEDYIVLTTEPEKVKEQYYTPNHQGFIKMASLPSYGNDNGIVVIAKKGGIIIDKFTYTSDMHFALLNNTEGVSLERISFDRPTEDKTNWHSAAETVGFATPAYQNSQYDEQIKNENEITIEPEIFSPDNDGYNDVLNINYHFNESGYLANITIYNSRGVLVKHLIKNELLGTQGSFSWDGINMNNEKTKIGIYIIYIEVFQPNGNVKHYKKTAVLGGKI